MVLISERVAELVVAPIMLLLLLGGITLSG
jgi:hypothetical protein